MSHNYYVGEKKYAEYAGRLRATLSILNARMAKYSTLGNSVRSSEVLFDDFAEILEFTRKAAVKDPSVERSLPLLEEASTFMTPAVLQILKFLHADELRKLARVYDLYDQEKNRRLTLEATFDAIARGDENAMTNFYESARTTVASMRDDLDVAVERYAEVQGRDLSDPLFEGLPECLERLDRRLDALWVVMFLDGQN